MHLGSGIDGVGYRLETRHQAVAKALHQDAAMARQYFGGDGMDEVCPSANGEGFMLLHEPHRFHKVDQQHDGLLLHEPHAPRVGGPGLLCLFVHRIIVHVDPTSRDPSLGILDRMEPRAKRSGQEGLGIVRGAWVTGRRTAPRPSPRAPSHFESAKVTKRSALFDEIDAPFLQHDTYRSEALDKASASGSNLTRQTRYRP
jgi:hypothetical protein